MMDAERIDLLRSLYTPSAMMSPQLVRNHVAECLDAVEAALAREARLVAALEEIEVSAYRWSHTVAARLPLTSSDMARVGERSVHLYHAKLAREALATARSASAAGEDK